MKKTHKNNNFNTCDTVHYTNVKKCDIIIVYYEKQHKGDYIMSKVKQWAEDTAEKSVDKIILNYKNNLITKETAISEIMKVDNLQMIGIDSENVEEVIEDTFYDKVAS